MFITILAAVVASASPVTQDTITAPVCVKLEDPKNLNSKCLQTITVKAGPTAPGVDNPAVTQATLSVTICKTTKEANGQTWIHNQRPPTSYTNALKAKQMAALGWTFDPRQVEEDHKVSIEDGGSPTDPNNLYPEPWNGDYGAHRKDVLETKLSHLVCKGTITLDEDRAALHGDWTVAYQKYVGPLPRGDGK